MTRPIMDFTTVVIVFFVVLAPVMLGFGFAAWAMVMKQRQLQLLLKERELLIEKGATDLPPLELPLAEKKRNGYGNLKWGLILVFIAAAAIITFFLSAPAASVGYEAHVVQVGNVWLLHFGTFTGAIGFALVAFHFIARAYQQQDAEAGRAVAAGKDQA